MSEKRKDSKGCILRNGEVQRSDGKYMFRYTDANGKRQTIYSWKLVSTDKVPEGKKYDKALRDMIQAIQRDLMDVLLYKENAENWKYEYRISEPKTKAGKRLIPMISDVQNALLEIKRRSDPKEKRNLLWMVTQTLSS